MSVYQINYDLRKQRNYQPLYERIKAYPKWCRPLESCWVISSNQTPSQVRDHLMSVMDNNDGLLVTKLNGEAAWFGIETSSFLKEMLETKAA